MYVYINMYVCMYIYILGPCGYTRTRGYTHTRGYGYGSGTNFAYGYGYGSGKLNSCLSVCTRIVSFVKQN